MTTFTDIAVDALQTLGIYAPGESIAAADMAQAQTTFNDMADFLSIQNLACYANMEQSFALVPGDGQYSIGPTGQIVAVRPMSIPVNSGAARIVDFEGNNYDVQVIDQFTWNQISTQLVTSQLPEVLFYDPQFPNGIINIWPIPSIAYTLYFDSRLAISEVATLTTAISLPPGYNLMLKRNLAKWLLPYFGDALGQLAQARVVADAKETLAAVKRKNSVTPLIGFDKSLVKKGGSSPYNIYTDGR